MPIVQRPGEIVEHPTISGRPERNPLPFQFCARCGKQYIYHGRDLCDDCYELFKGGVLDGLDRECGEDGCNVNY